MGGELCWKIFYFFRKKKWKKEKRKEGVWGGGGVGWGGHWQQSPLPNHLSNHVHSVFVPACWPAVSASAWFIQVALTLKTMPRLSKFIRAIQGLVRKKSCVCGGTNADSPGKFGHFGWSRWENLNSFLKPTWNHNPTFWKSDQSFTCLGRDDAHRFLQKYPHFTSALCPLLSSSWRRKMDQTHYPNF